MRAIVLASGKGTRLNEITKDLPKSMVIIGNKPILEHIISNLRENRIRNITLVVGYKKEKIIDYFSDGKKFGVKISYAEQKKPDAGTADAVCSVEKIIGEDRFLLIYGDVVFEKDLIKELTSKSKKSNFIICVKKVENPENYGVVEIKNGRVVRVVEKMQNPPSNLVNAGIYILPKEIFTAINKTKPSKRGEYELTDSIQILIDGGFECEFVLVGGFWIDIGNKENLMIAKKYLE
jgi:bifunctional UDP-N-acetylglucosamine pyrophosphorylase/glucosamine-1-phosphate N-acetyltransferase